MTRNGFECYICSLYIPDGCGFTVINNRTQDSLSCHRACLTSILAPRVSSKLATRTVQRRRKRAQRAGYR